ncbi:MAG: hypothetical protein FWC77_06120 [Defluviitaleaceae bacterium]|nr:hypothetical protein [Defluviitaleaceae bacterium]
MKTRKFVMAIMALVMMFAVAVPVVAAEVDLAPAMYNCCMVVDGVKQGDCVDADVEFEAFNFCQHQPTRMYTNAYFLERVRIYSLNGVFIREDYVRVSRRVFVGVFCSRCGEQLLF